MNATLQHTSNDLLSPQDFESLLADATALARRYLSRFESLVLVRVERRRYRLIEQTADHWPHALPAGAPPQAEQAAELLRRAHALREAVAQQALSPAVAEALEVGRLAAQAWQWHDEARRAG